MGEQLTDRQREILEFIREFQRNRKCPPAVREIGEGVGLSSPCTVYRHLETLEKRGFIRRNRGPQNKSLARSIELVEDEAGATPLRAVPLIGQIAAGSPILAEENREGTIPVPAEQLGAGEFFALRVKGDSMIEDGIFDGDIVVLRSQATAEENDIVAAFTPHDAEGTATLKRFHREGDRVRLQPANQRLAPIWLDHASELRILGKAVYLTRQLH